MAQGFISRDNFDPNNFGESESDQGDQMEVDDAYSHPNSSFGENQAIRTGAQKHDPVDFTIHSQLLQELIVNFSNLTKTNIHSKVLSPF